MPLIWTLLVGSTSGNLSFRAGIITHLRRHHSVRLHYYSLNITNLSIIYLVHRDIYIWSLWRRYVRIPITWWDCHDAHRLVWSKAHGDRSSCTIVRRTYLNLYSANLNAFHMRLLGCCMSLISSTSNNHSPSIASPNSVNITMVCFSMLSSCRWSYDPGYVGMVSGSDVRIVELSCVKENSFLWARLWSW